MRQCSKRMHADTPRIRCVLDDAVLQSIAPRRILAWRVSDEAALTGWRSACSLLLLKAMATGQPAWH